ncbi:ankyrin repeat-containing domain protein [Sphaerosporella brunnea]|uniref:Ankyrin repeat-containing domain protein n=1 Tax=Sphaerosporella brunnea TaxID=1250544 RepID=A0A5J5EF45_9PEZI|nr:ankyrin repeat-containing domain protein [Sphaerosporella brunnea]
MVKFSKAEATFETVVRLTKEWLEIENEKLRSSQDYIDARKSLKPSKYEDYRDELWRKRHEGSCTWLLHDERYKAWAVWAEENHQPILWISGDPGCGKSVLSAFLCKEILPNKESPVSVAYFFCDDKDERLRTAHAILVDLLDQLLEQLPRVVVHFSESAELKYREKTSWTYTALWRVFERVISDDRTGRVYLLIDALDECDGKSRTKLLDQLQRLFSDDTIRRRIKIAITSRPHVPVSSHLTDLIQIPLIAEKLKDDITLFVDSRVHRLFKGGLIDEVRQALVGGADGMFLWVSLMLEEFEMATTTTPRAIRERLKALPRGLPAVYENILGRIQPEDRKRAENILQWVTWAMRPLTLEELAIAIAIRTDMSSLSEIEDDIETDPRKVLRLIFGPMLKIEVDDTVHLVHQSAKDFLIGGNLLSAFRLSSLECNLRLAESCLTYLSFKECEAGPVDAIHIWRPNVRPRIESRQRKLRFLNYSAIHWPNHTRQTDQENNAQRRLSGTFRKLAESRPKIALAYQILCFSRHRGFVETAPLQIAASLGLVAFVNDLLEVGANVNAQGGYYRNALQAAAATGENEAVVRLLIEKGADVNAQGGEYGNALLAAIGNGHEAVIRLLVEKGADVNAQGGEYGNALLAAIGNGHEAVIRLLVEKGADVNAQDGFYGNALQAAARKGNEAVIRLLIEKGADVNSQGGKYGNALQAAAWKGNEAVIRLLIEKGADVNAQGGEYGNALLAAIGNGHEAVIRLLVEKGADVNAQGSQYGNALQAAAATGENEAVVRLLIEKGADVNAQGSQYGNALHAAAWKGNEAVVRLLIEKGADVNAHGSQYGNALQAAKAAENQAVVRLLIENGAIV